MKKRFDGGMSPPHLGCQNLVSLTLSVERKGNIPAALRCSPGHGNRMGSIRVSRVRGAVPGDAMRRPHFFAIIR